jgi:uncharacterized membrane protein YfcA
MFGMSGQEVAVVIFGLLLAGFVKGASGVGYSTTAIPVLTLGLGLENAIPLVLLPSIASNVFVMLDAGNFEKTLRRFAPLYLGLLPGLMAGLFSLYYLDKPMAAAVLGAVIIIYGCYALPRANLSLPENLERPLRLPVGLCNGFINGLTGSQIMPVVPYMLALRLTPNEVVQGTNIAFTLSSFVMIAGLAGMGYLDWGKLIISALGIALSFAGVQLGTRVRKRIPAETFRQLVLGLLVVLGICLIIPIL